MPTITRRNQLILLLGLLALSGLTAYAYRASARWRGHSVPPTAAPIARLSPPLARTTTVRMVTAANAAPVIEPVQSGGSYNITQSVVSGGGGSSANGNTSVTGTVGQAAAAASSGGFYTVSGGFWSGAASGGCPMITVAPPGPALATGTAGTFYSQTFTQTGGAGGVTFSLSAGTFPNGLTLTTEGILSGTSTVFGSFSFTIRATDANTCFGERAYTLTISPPGCPTIMPGTISNSGVISTAYSQTISVAGGTGPYGFAVTSGALPPGLSLHPTTGRLSGTPTATGTFNFSVTATDANNCTGTRAYTVTITGLQYYPLAKPIRLYDTRAPIMGFTPCAYLSQRIPNNGTLTRTAYVTCDGVTIPTMARAIVGNATVVNPTGAGFATLWPAGQTQPPVSTLNYVAGDVIPNGFTVSLNANGQFSAFSLADTDLIIDITGYYAPPGANGLYYHPLPTPIRLFDSRASIPGFAACAYLNAPFQGNTEYTRQARITCNSITIPSDAAAIVGNATIVNPSGGGFATLWPDGQTRPPVSLLNYTAGQVVPNNFTVSLGTNGEFRLYSLATTDLIIDVTGYFSPSASDVNGAGLLYVPLGKPIRLYDTRAPIAGFTPCEYLNQSLPANGTLTKQARITCNGETIPLTAAAVVGNATVVSPSGGGFITLWPNGPAQPPVSNLNYVMGQVVPNGFTIKLGADGQFNAFTVQSTNLIVDLSGYFAP